MKHLIFNVEKSEDSLGLLLWKTMTVWQRQIKKALDPYHISHPQFVMLAMTLWYSLHHRAVTQSLLIRESKLDKMTVSIAIRKLVDQDYLKHQTHQVDTRAKQVELTVSGKALAKKLVPLIESIDAQFFSVLSKKNRTELINMFTKLSISDWEK